MEISVVIPVYKAEEKLRRCLDSVKAQTFEDFEVVLVDDGSPDGCGEICDEYARQDPRFRVLHQKNQGAAAARNNGMLAARGTYLSFVDSDDYLEPDFLEKLYGGITRHQADFCMCNYIGVGQDGSRTVSNHGFPNHQVLNREEIRSIIFFDHIFRCRATDGLFGPCNKIIKREIVLQNHLAMDPAMSFGEDMLFVVAYLKCCNSAVFIPEALYNYEQLASGLFSRYRPALLADALTCFRQLKKEAAPPAVSEEQFLPLTLKYHYYVDRYLQMGICREKHKKAFVRSVLSNPDVLEIYDRIALFSETLQKEWGWDLYELRVPSLIHRRKMRTATAYLLYQYNENHFLRKLRRVFKKSE